MSPWPHVHQEDGAGDACSYPIETGCDMGPAKILLGASPYNPNGLIKRGGTMQHTGDYCSWAGDDRRGRSRSTEQLGAPGSCQHEVAVRIPPSLAGRFGMRVALPSLNPRWPQELVQLSTGLCSQSCSADISRGCPGTPRAPSWCHTVSPPTGDTAAAKNQCQGRGLRKTLHGKRPRGAGDALGLSLLSWDVWSRRRAPKELQRVEMCPFQPRPPTVPSPGQSRRRSTAVPRRTAAAPQCQTPGSGVFVIVSPGCLQVPIWSRAAVAVPFPRSGLSSAKPDP